ncbi:hypothetical protein [Nocardiopsis suaedae]|uniref:Terminase n=1 Tax=Nocardiopsis suaedae TaxID=3018444 RepID=A0ABT4TN96_9ACTN|nr:hypothetical protein [Nocardiopsis suaedae]MDA2805714.1 hypothetical protein [Nocardiopsis suaedae]
MAKAPNPAAEFVVDFPTLWIVPDWIERHCPVPDGFRAGETMELYPWQLWCTVNHYRVKPEAKPGQLATAFAYRRSQVVAPQKTGKGPWSATLILAEAVGPVVFADWAGGGEVYRCAAHGCGCGWWYEYRPGEPMGRPWPTPLIQLTATSEDQTDNVYRPLRSMIRQGPLAEVLPKAGEEFIRLPGGGRIDVVTSSATSRLGQPITMALQDETGIWTPTNKMTKTADTQRRGLAGMGGRAIETTNSWDPSEDSVAQRTAQSRRPDIFRYHPQAPKGLSYTDKRQRRRIHRYVYAGSSHVDLDGIEAEAAELLERDPAQAERFFGNRVVSGTASWLDGAAWEKRAAPRAVRPHSRVVLGFDGSDIDDHTAIRAETLDGYQFTPVYGPDRKPTVWNPADYPDGQVPRLEVAAAMDELMRRFDVVRLYADPPYWESEVDAWVDAYGDRRVIRWQTRRVVQMHAAAERLRTDVLKKDTTWSHDGCPLTADHVANTRTAARPGDRYVLRKASDAQKIDAAVTSVLAHEAAGDVIAAGAARKRRTYVYTA